MSTIVYKGVKLNICKWYNLRKEDCKRLELDTNDDNCISITPPGYDNVGGEIVDSFYFEEELYSVRLIGSTVVNMTVLSNKNYF